MSATGTWNMTLSTKLGAQSMLLHIAETEGAFTGRIESPMGSAEIAGTVAGSKLSWAMKIRKPIPMSASYELSIDGDSLSGTAKLGLLGKAAVSGERVTSSAPVSVAAEEADEVLTEAATDPQYNQLYIDVNELRESPVPHRYVHGGFTGTGAQFSFYFPPQAQYQGRFFHNTYPMALTSDIGPFPIAFDVAMGDLGFAMDSGAYYVQTNLGGTDRTPTADPAIGAYRVNAAAAKYSRVVAAELYGPHRPFGYLFGGSGGSYQTIGAAENTSGIWDGFVPFVMGCPNAIPSMFTIRMHALRILNERNKLPGIADAVAVGGSGDPYAGLDKEEYTALREATLMGFPLRGWWKYATMGSGYFYNVAPLMPMLDPTYMEDFWSKPGYLGSDPTASIHAARFSFETEVSGVIPGFPQHLELASVPDRDFADAHIVMQSGAAKGKSIPLAGIEGRTIGFAYAADHATLATIKVGDKLRIDNSWVLALQTMHHHQVPTPDLYGWNQYRDADGEPIYPQREILIGPLGAAGTAGSVPRGRIHGKMLMLQGLLDIDAFAWQADWYREQVKGCLGDGYEDQFALWFTDHTQHDNPESTQANAHVVSFAGALQQALRDLSAWVEKGVRPVNTKYSVVDTQVLLPASAAERGGIQPVVELKANGGLRAEVTAGEAVNFSAIVEVPSGAGEVVSAEWDFEGVGDYPIAETLPAAQSRLTLSATHSYTRPGTYFAVLRAASQRQGDRHTAYGRVQNLGTVRVVVS